MRAQMQGIALRGGRGGVLGTLSISNGGYEDIASAPSSATAVFTLVSDGTTASNVGAEPNWLLGSTSGSLYECRATLGSGTLSTGTAGSWLPLSSNRGWGVSRASLGSKSCSFLLEIGLAGANVALDSASITLTAEVTFEEGGP